MSERTRWILRAAAASVMSRRCGVPRPAFGFAVALYHYLREVGIDEVTSYTTAQLIMSPPPSYPLHDPEFVAGLPAAECEAILHNGIALRVTADAVELPAGAGGLEGWLAQEVDREYPPEDDDEMRPPSVIVIADADAPAGRIIEVAEAAPPGTKVLLLARNPTRAPDNPEATLMLLPIARDLDLEAGEAVASLALRLPCSDD